MSGTPEQVTIDVAVEGTVQAEDVTGAWRLWVEDGGVSDQV